MRHARRAVLALAAVAALFAAASGTDRPPTAPERDLAAAEAAGGHTLSRHVGLGDAELRERLRAEPGIATASSFTDRATAQQVVGEALDSAAARIESWSRGDGRRANLVIEHRGRPGRTLGRSWRRGERSAVARHAARVVLAWNDGAPFVLTAYPVPQR